MIKDIPHLLVGYYRYVKNNLLYVNSLNISNEEKKKWKKYTVKRDWYRFLSAYRAGKYYKSSEQKRKKMDRKYS